MPEPMSPLKWPQRSDRYPLLHTLCMAPHREWETLGEISITNRIYGEWNKQGVRQRVKRE